ncbi:MAG: ThiF family adenylyltransferase [Euryarchaeota archaeon]|nr:ThiF family adenylyltransferase [Euryarchaeota archaeon]
MKHERQTLIKGWDQAAISRASVLVAGAGAIGSALVTMLTRLGVGAITIIDPDRLEAQNLENQAYDESDLGKSKAFALAERMHRIDPALRVTPVACRIEDYRGPVDADYLFGCFDNVAARHYINFMAVTGGKTLVDAGIENFWGAIKTIIPGKTACQGCLPTVQSSAVKASCSSDPIPSTFVTANMAAGLQAIQFLKLVRGERVHSYVYFDLARSTLYNYDYKPNPKCEICGGST